MRPFRPSIPRPRRSRPSQSPSSSLGLRRIGDIHVSQLLRASPSDLSRLRSFTQSYDIPDFSSWSLLLRALTHPSMSNWAEHLLKLKKRSLGPNALELLGDRVVGVSVASKALEWIENGLPSLEKWALRYGASSIVGALTGNRGMALVSREIGIEDMMRWEKAPPPAKHRDRLNSDGIDSTTGLGVSREMNALAGAYEAVVAATYLDGGLDMASTFVNASLLERTHHVIQENKPTTEFELDVVKEIAEWVGVPLWDLGDWGKVWAKAAVLRSFSKRVEFALVDLFPEEEQGEASPIFFAAVALRRKGKEGALSEKDLISVASHFSMEMARNAALIQAAEMLRGEREAGLGAERGRGRAMCMTVRAHADKWDNDIFVSMGVDGCRWFHDGDYMHLTEILYDVDVKDKENLTGLDNISAKDARDRIRSLATQRRIREEQRRKDADSRQQYRQRAPIAAVNLGGGVVCHNTIAKCLEIGHDVHENDTFLQQYPHLHASEDAEGLAMAIAKTMQSLSEGSRDEQVQKVRGFNCVGKHTFRLWATQRSMKDVSQARGEIIDEGLVRLGSVDEIESKMYGGRGLDAIEGLGKSRSGLFALGVCATRVSVPTALQWLSGAEEWVNRDGG